ncbi:putative DNA-binding transcriptional regulator AlpA [Sulfitobacter undariae]|uniref:Putative DNA-binding transcriptional regulator AlpA n=1 Tax=Sulfitobacter undariae TaxID=1563671 RepID=A0A7W6H1H7_9RHOB|nr:AlpA family transcriptional regulator [Sulfitobacter undariae]MBB3993769.1 putative DNA-binding transcriptional regulator AlpA [Sulfitobacter undariae]
MNTHISTLPADGYVRIRQIIGDKKTGITGVLPVSRTYFYALIANKKFPAPKKVGNASLWNVDEVRLALANLSK